MEQKYGLFSEHEKMWHTKLLPRPLLNGINLAIFSEKCKPQQSIESNIPANRFWQAEEASNKFPVLLALGNGVDLGLGAQK